MIGEKSAEEPKVINQPRKILVRVQEAEYLQRMINHKNSLV